VTASATAGEKTLLEKLRRNASLKLGKRNICIIELLGIGESLEKYLFSVEKHSCQSCTETLHLVHN
jgi:hypothetical protein